MLHAWALEPVGCKRQPTRTVARRGAYQNVIKWRLVKSAVEEAKDKERESAQACLGSRTLRRSLCRSGRSLDGCLVAEPCCWSFALAALCLDVAVWEAKYAEGGRWEVG